MTPADFANWLIDPDRRPLVMGVLNVTPDSFSDGGRFSQVDAAVAQARAMAQAGADLIDIGGESTRPGAARVKASEQLRRIEPVISALAGNLPAIISVDTTRAAVAMGALAAGAHLVNDISAGSDDPAMLPAVAEARCPVILMHMQGQSANMQASPTYNDVMKEVSEHLEHRLDAAVAAGVRLDRVLLDPGIGFGKSLEHNLQLLHRQRELTALGRPLVIGTSRKSFVGKITGEVEPASRIFGTAASVAWAIANGAAVVRVHDVEPMVRVVRMIRSIICERMPEKL